MCFLLITGVLEEYGYKPSSIGSEKVCWRYDFFLIERGWERVCSKKGEMRKNEVLVPG